MSNNLIVQSYLGDLPSYARLSISHLKKYAKKIGVGYEFYDKVTLSGLDSSVKVHRYYNILEVIYNPRYDVYDDIAYFDVDVLVDQDADNIFEQKRGDFIDVMGIPENALGRYMPGFYLRNQWVQFIRKYISMDCDPPSHGKPTTLEQINTGVIVFTKKGRMKARQNFDPWLPWANDPNYPILYNNDQPYLNGMFSKHKFNIQRLSDEWNMPPMWFTTFPCPKAHFYHFSNSDGKNSMLNFRNDSPAGKIF